MAGLGWLTVDQFEGRVGETFEVTSDGGPTIRTELVEVTESAELGGRGPAGEERRQFSLVFHGPAEPVLPQSIHRLEHAELGELHLFLVPLGPAGERMRYEAVFA